MRPDDVLLSAADHGNDPTHLATADHAREYVPILVTGPRVRAGAAFGTRRTFADVYATVKELLGLVPKGPCASFAAARKSSARGSAVPARGRRTLGPRTCQPRATSAEASQAGLEAVCG